MSREKRRPALEELKALPVELWRLEVAQIEYEASTSESWGIEQEAAALFDDPDITPEKVVALWEKLKRGTGSTSADHVELIPCPAA